MSVRNLKYIYRAFLTLGINFMERNVNCYCFVCIDLSKKKKKIIKYLMFNTDSDSNNF